MHRIYRLLAAILLLSYVSTGTAVIPGVLMTLAELDGSHLVVVRFTESGTQVLLHHREGEFTPEVCDHESKLAQCLVCLCEPSKEGDHSLASMGMSGSHESSSNEAKREIKEPTLLNTNTVASTVDVCARPSYPIRVWTPSVHNRVWSCHRTVSTVRLLI